MPAPRTGSDASSGRTLARWLPWIISLGAHAALIVAAFYVVWTVAPAKAERDPAVVDLESLAPSALPSTSPELAATTDAPEFIPPPLELPPLPELDVPALSHEEEVVSPPVPSVPSMPEQAAVAAPVRFFASSTTTANDIIFVVDASASMVSTLPIVLDELTRTLSTLAPTQRFQVIFFQADDYIPTPHPDDSASGGKKTRLIRATRDSIDAALLHAADITPRGTSDPIPALATALALEPDAVFLLSRGLADLPRPAEEILEELDAFNPADASTGRRPAVIRAIQFLDQDPSGLLRTIALEHSPPAQADAAWTYISRDDLRRPR